MKKIAFLLAALFTGYGAVQGQVLRVANYTNCDIMYYGGQVVVSGVTYSFFGSEDPADNAIIHPGINYLTIQSPAPTAPAGIVTVVNDLVPQPLPAVSAIAFIGFKMRLPGVTGPYTGGCYISAANPAVVSGPTPVGGCNNGNPFTVQWLGSADNPTIEIN
ncbi:MAG: hypothetical protein P4L41_05470 [Flavipsychrobacter sp.]|nr:hypothetical protein [Flavipsychrobacter sp.]